MIFMRYKWSEKYKTAYVTKSELRAALHWVGRKGPFEMTFDLMPKMGTQNEPAMGEMKVEQLK